MLGLINTRPIWNEGDKLWSEELRCVLNNVKVIDAPLQMLSLTNSVNVGNELFSWLSSVTSNKSYGYLIFTSPSSVKALAKHLGYFNNPKEQFLNCSENHHQIANSLVSGICEYRIKAATIGIGTKNQLIEFINILIPTESDSKTFFLDFKFKVNFLIIFLNFFVKISFLFFDKFFFKYHSQNKLASSINISFLYFGIWYSFFLKFKTFLSLIDCICLSVLITFLK